MVRCACDTDVMAFVPTKELLYNVPNAKKNSEICKRSLSREREISIGLLFQFVLEKDHLDKKISQFGFDI